MPEKHIGKVVQITGPVLDIRFKDGELPALLNAVELDNHGICIKWRRTKPFHALFK